MFKTTTKLKKTWLNNWNCFLITSNINGQDWVWLKWMLILFLNLGRSVLTLIKKLIWIRHLENFNLNLLIRWSKLVYTFKMKIMEQFNILVYVLGFLLRKMIIKLRLNWFLMIFRTRKIGVYQIKCGKLWNLSILGYGTMNMLGTVIMATTIWIIG